MTTNNLLNILMFNRLMNTMKIMRVTQQALAVVAIFAMAMLSSQGLFAQTAEAVVISPYGTDPISSVRICHHNNGNEFVNNQPSVTSSGAPQGGHDNMNGAHAPDIIPPYYYLDGDDVVQFYSGKNWSADYSGYTGAQVWTNNCVVPIPPTTGSLTVIKHVVNDDGGLKVAADFTMTVTGTEVSNPSFAGSESGVVVTLKPGSYSVDESDTFGYTKTLGTGCAGDIVAGQSYSCTITNDDPEPAPDTAALTIVKEVEAVQGVSVPSTWSFDFAHTDSTDFTLDDGETSKLFSGEIVGVHNFSEKTPLAADWYLTGVTCNLPTDQWSVNTETDELEVTLVADNNATCTFTNTYRPVIDPQLGSISGAKYDWDTENKLAGWTIFLDENDNETLDEGEKSVVTDGNGNYIFNNLVDGNYSVCEVAQTGWTQKGPDTANGCFAVTITEGSDSTGNNFWNEEDKILGCTDDSANNFYEEAEVDDGSCTYGYVSLCEDTPNLLSNASFEDPVVTNASKWQKFATVSGWLIEKVSDDSATTLELWRGLGIGASDGEQNAELDGDQPVKVTQTVNSLIPGATYELSFDFVARANTGGEENNHIEASVDDSTLVLTVSTDEVEHWWKYGDTFVADDSSVDVSFKDLGTPADTYGTLLDNAVLCLVSEPKVPGCTDSDATNYNPDATVDDESCEYSSGGGGGGGSAVARCSLFEADRDGNEVTLNWETRNGSSMTIMSGTDEIFATDDNDVVDEGEFSFDSADAAEFELTVYRGTRKDTCSAEILGLVGPTPQVLGEQVSAVPYGAAAAGAGGTSPAELPRIQTISAVLLRDVARVAKNG